MTLDGGIAEVAVATDAAMLATLSTIGLQLVNAVKVMLSQPGSGIVYGNHQASAPGQPPAVDTGRLRSSYAFKVGRDGAGGYVDVGTSVEYAAFLEFGTTVMAARPHLRPAVETERLRIQGLVVEEITTAQRAVIARLPREIIIE